MQERTLGRLQVFRLGEKVRGAPLFLSIVCLLLSVFLPGCAITGPYVSQQEIEMAQDELKVKALKFQIDYLVKVNNIGYKLLLSLPQEDSQDSFVYTGLLLANVDKYLKKLYNLSIDKGVVVIGLVDDSPAKKSGMAQGDLITRAEGLEVNDLADIAYVFDHKAPTQLVELKVIRQGAPQDFGFRLGKKPLNISFRMVDEQEVNAGASTNIIVVTYGLMRFVKNDDEVAVVLGHELAHIARSHHIKVSGIDLISIIAGIAAGIGAEKVSPGTGDVVMQSISQALSARYSKDFEREADYFGLKYVYLAGYNIEAGVDVWERFAIEVPQSMTRNFFSTHPSSPERMVRIKKIIQELKSGVNPTPTVDAQKTKKD